ncbi:ATP11-domain-containing protein [Polyporus arcularius HHB13444]|uniref:ATP11-domain-containing protein n=1 Tax=Polyporus arcularius HHB13444 TaxID=1314778 RepID=A0A5C3PY28_9APHY|nr:ATP11-domain-containing protein [Polyporus arcularius HHB13444]
MLSRSLLPFYPRHGRLPVGGVRLFSSTCMKRDVGLSSPRINYDEKYAEKLQRRAQEQGKTVADLRAEIKERERQERLRRLQRLKEETSKASEVLSDFSASTSPSSSSSTATVSPPASAPRKDSSPVKPLSSIINFDKLLQNTHTPEQISVLWRAYHESRSGGTGRGYLCATIPVETYQKMLDVASKYPTFILPVPRENAQLEDGSNEPAYEFYLMEWGFHGAPPEPMTADDLFSSPKPSSNPQTSTILFTPLQEYKLRQSFATPYLVLTHYTDLVKTHGLVLLRGEITPSGASAGVGVGEDGARFMLSQQDAQLLAIHLQRFYLWHEGSDERAALLKAFHERPSEFKWEDLLKHTDFSA